LAYIAEPIMFTGINIYQRCIAETFPIITSEDSAVQAMINKILTRTAFREVFSDYAVRHLGIFGNAFIGYVYDEKKEVIVEFNIVDPKSMRFQEDQVGNVILDAYGLPVGYVQEIAGYPQITFSRAEMIHLSINQVNRGEMGIGFIEPVYQDITLKENIERAKAQSAFRKGFPLPIVKFGSDANPPNAAMRDKARELASAIARDTTTSVAYPYFFDIDFLEVPTAAPALEEDLLYTTKLQAAVLGIPVAVLLGTGEKESAGTLETLLEFFEFNLRGLQEALRIPEVIAFVLKSHKFKDFDFKVQWRSLTERSAKEQVMRIMRLSKVGLIRSDPALEAYLKRLVGLPSEEIPERERGERSFGI